MNKYLSIFGAIIILQSCTSDDKITELSLGNYVNGFFILNEGGVGSVTYISEDFTTVENDIYKHNNDNSDLGNYVQSMFFENELAFIISNGSNLITIVNRYTFKTVGVVNSGIEVPRYGVVVDGKAYITNQASFQTSDDDYIAVVNLETFEVEDTFLVGDTVEYIQTNGSNLFVQNAAYGFGNHISVIDPSNGDVIERIETSQGLNEFELYGNYLYALSSNELEIFNLSNLELSKTVDLNNSSAPRHLEVNNDTIFYTVSNSVYSMSISAVNAPTSPFVTYESQSAYGVMYGFKSYNNKIFIADGGDFASNSFIEVYDLNGTKLFSTDVGIAPNGFYFNY
ncbi:DUF5074 domain-containing protein [Aegicerativicinus sediminis]|uniref:DUF5074 domain-containing protein n=1 Tax=Aegicerativicinus sediminis TaxID=2893202 RepID=UPI001E52064A|nr:DUF5074 domain-containing protein [Aegicerativicinus sediminis]